MIYLVQNDREYDYDVRAIALAFYERTKIVEVTKEEFEEQEWEKDDLLLTLVYTTMNKEEKKSRFCRSPHACLYKKTYSGLVKR